MILIEKKPYLLTRSWLDHDFEYLIFENFQKKAVKSPSAKKPRESRRISAKPRRKNPMKARRTLGEKNPWKLGELSAKKPRESSANSRRKNPVKARRTLGEKPRESSANSRRKKPRKSSAKSRRKCSPREISRVSGRKGGEANGFSSSGGESERVRLGSPPFRSRRNSGGEFTSLI
jgi:hypothetical protein